MPRNMSFMITKPQMYGRTKTVTRRNGWKNVKPGDKIWAVEKGMGLKKGEKIKRICMIEVTHVRFEGLNSILRSDVALEGFPAMDRLDFIDMFIKSHKEVSHFSPVTRIEFKHIGITELPSPIDYDCYAKCPWFCGTHTCDWNPESGKIEHDTECCGKPVKWDLRNDGSIWITPVRTKADLKYMEGMENAP